MIGYADYRNTWVYQVWTQAFSDEGPVWIGWDLAAGPDISVETPVPPSTLPVLYGGRQSGKSARYAALKEAIESGTIKISRPTPAIILPHPNPADR